MQQRENPKKHWCITLFDGDVKLVMQNLFETDILVYAVGQLELCPSTNRPHWQCYVCYTKKVRFTSLKKDFGSSAHIEPMRGTPLECKLYCSKEESRADPYDSFEFGVLPGSEKKEGSVLLEECCELLRTGSGMSVIADQYPTVFVRNNRGLNAFAKAIRAPPPPEFQPVTVWILWGDAGSGKTRAVFDWLRRSRKSYYRKSYSRSSQSWWDGYVDQEVLFLDDFEGERCGCPVDEFLNLTDGYGHTKLWPVKGDFVSIAGVRTIFITSNTAPDTWYSMQPEKRAAVLRRCVNIHEVRLGVDFRAIPMPEILALVQPRTRSRSRSPRRQSVSPLSPALSDVLLSQPQALSPTPVLPPATFSDFFVEPTQPLVPARPLALKRATALFGGDLY